MPLNVRYFIVFSYVSLGLGIAELVVSMPAMKLVAPLISGDRFLIATSAVALVFTALYAALIALAGWGRRDWARWVLLVAFAFALGFDLLALPETLRDGTLADLLSWIGTGFQGVALYLIFTGSAKSWFVRDVAVTS